MKPSSRFLWWYLNTYIFKVVYFFLKISTTVRVFPKHRGKQSACQSRRRRFDPWVSSILWMRKWQPTPVFLLGDSHGQRSLVGYSPWDHKNKILGWIHYYIAINMIYIFIFRFQNKSILWPLKVQLALDTVPPCLTGQTGLLAWSTALHSWVPQMVPSLNTQSCVATFLPWHSISWGHELSSDWVYRVALYVPRT